MKELSNSNRHDPFGWSYWASSHGSPDPPSTQEPKDPNAMRLYRQCKHGGNGLWEPHFLSWHRAFLFFFEAVLKQAAVESRETTAFDLPYWKWYEDPLPQIFKEGDEKTNPLFHVRGSLAGGSVDLDKLINTRSLDGPLPKRRLSYCSGCATREYVPLPARRESAWHSA
jgi:hypothetical protein